MAPIILKGAVTIAVPTVIVALVTAAAAMPTDVAQEEQNTVDINIKKNCADVFKFFKIYLFILLNKVRKNPLLRS